MVVVEAPVAQSVERLTTNPTTPAGPWFDPQSEQIFFRASCPTSSDEATYGLAEVRKKDMGYFTLLGAIMDISILSVL